MTTPRKSLTAQTISAGNSTATFDVLVNGDTAVEPDETFLVNVTNVTGATVADGQGQGTIVNDDAAVCGDPFTPIYTIQGSGAATAIPGIVTTEGVVVGDFEGTAANSGFYIQDPTGDGNASTSDGIFVFTGNASTVERGRPRSRHRLRPGALQPDDAERLEQRQRGGACSQHPHLQRGTTASRRPT